MNDQTLIDHVVIIAILLIVFVLGLKGTKIFDWVAGKLHDPLYDLQEDFYEYEHALITSNSPDYKKMEEGIEEFRKHHCQFVPEEEVNLYVQRLKQTLDEIRHQYSYS